MREVESVGRRVVDEEVYWGLYPLQYTLNAGNNIRTTSTSKFIENSSQNEGRHCVNLILVQYPVLQMAEDLAKQLDNVKLDKDEWNSALWDGNKAFSSWADDAEANLPPTLVPGDFSEPCFRPQRIQPERFSSSRDNARDRECRTRDGEPVRTPPFTQRRERTTDHQSSPHTSSSPVIGVAPKDLTYILEAYDYHPDLSEYDLDLYISAMVARGATKPYVKKVDDCHSLVVFATPEDADAVLVEVRNKGASVAQEGSDADEKNTSPPPPPLPRSRARKGPARDFPLRPIAQTTNRNTQRIARADVPPAKARPRANAGVAHRLIRGALGPAFRSAERTAGGPAAVALRRMQREKIPDK